MRTLFVVAKPLYPPSGGSAVRNWQNIEAAGRLGPVAAVAVTGVSSQTAANPPTLSLSRTFTVPPLAPNLTARLRRSLWLLDRYGYPIARRLFRPDVAAQLHGVVTEFRPDVAVFAEPWLYQYLKVVEAASVPTILDCHNIEAHIRASFPPQRGGAFAGVLWRRGLHQLEAMERDFIARSASVWVCSAEDRETCSEFYGREDGVEIVPSGVDIEYYRPVAEGTVEPPAGFHRGDPTVGMVASYGYEPNAEAALALIQDILPRLRRTGVRWRLVLAGRDPTATMLAAASGDPDITVTGIVPDVRPWLSAISVIAVPLQRGGGTRLKLLEAFAAGRPVVSTSKGAEGIAAIDGEHITAADDPEAIANAVARLHRDRSLANARAAQALELVNRRYSPEAIAARVEQALLLVVRGGNRR